MDERQAVSTLRRWCPIERFHVDLDELVCPGEHWETWERRTHRLRKRRMLVCSVCQQGYFNQQEFDEHECWSAY